MDMILRNLWPTNFEEC